MANSQNTVALKITCVGDPALTALSGMVVSAAMQQYLFVKMGSTVSDDQNPTILPIAAATDRPLGVLWNSPRVHFDQVTGYVNNVDEAEVIQVGVVKVQAGGTVNQGDCLGINSTGQVVTIVPGTDTTKYIIGTAVTGGVSGDVIMASISTPSCGRAA